MRTTDLRAANERRCRRLVDRSAPVAQDDLDWAAVPETPIDEDTWATLLYMRDVEGFTDRDLSGFAGHPTTRADPLVADFLDAWRAEEGEHARALDRFLRAYAEGRRIPLAPRQPSPTSVPPLRERILVPLTRPIGPVITAAHMVWGAANELLALHAYRILGHRCGHPQLEVLLARISAQEARHYSFYALQAQWRLDASRLARRAIPAMLRREWTPVGVGDGYKAPEEFSRVLRYLSRGPDGRTTTGRMDEAFTRLPGMEDLPLFSRMLAGLSDEEPSEAAVAA